ncbi:MAG TPA: hypothetical protein VIW92_10120, partial [Thermoanaerobaculia bacterium]
LAPLIAELRAWDRIGRIDSVAMTLFTNWFTRYRQVRGRPETAAEPWPRIKVLEAVRTQL